MDWKLNKMTPKNTRNVMNSLFWSIILLSLLTYNFQSYQIENKFLDFENHKKHLSNFYSHFSITKTFSPKKNK